MVLIFSSLLVSNWLMCRFCGLVNEKLSLCVMLVLKMLRCLVWFMLGMIMCRLCRCLGFILVSECERKFVCFWLLFFSMMWLCGVSSVLSVVMMLLVGMILLLVMWCVVVRWCFFLLCCWCYCGGMGVLILFVDWLGIGCIGWCF